MQFWISNLQKKCTIISISNGTIQKAPLFRRVARNLKGGLFLESGGGGPALEDFVIFWKN